MTTMLRTPPAAPARWRPAEDCPALASPCIEPECQAPPFYPCCEWFDYGRGQSGYWYVCSPHHPRE